MVYLSKIWSYLTRIFAGLGILGWLAVMTMMLWGAINAIVSIIGWALPATVEYTEILNVFAIILPLPYVGILRAHLSIDILYERWSTITKHWFDIVALLLSLGFLTFLTYSLTIQAWESTQIGEFVDAAIRVYYWPAKIVLAFSFLLAAIVALLDIIINFLKGSESYSSI